MNNIGANIVIVGGGFSGFAAAIAAASEGKNVTLVERSNLLGGNATHANVGTICGAYYRSHGSPVLSGHQFGRNLISSLIEKGVCGQPVCHHKGLYILRYEWEKLNDFLMKEMAMWDITLLKNTNVVDVSVNNCSIDHVVIETESVNACIKVGAIVDCSGVAVISSLANDELITSKSYQSASQVFRVSNIDSNQEFMVNLALKKAMRHLIQAEKWPLSFQSLSIIPGSLKEGVADLKFTLPDVINDDPGLYVLLAKKAKEYIRFFFPVIQNNVSLFRNAVVEIIFPSPGIRIQKRPKGRYVLTEQDVLECKKFNDGIAMGTWPIEEWEYDGSLIMEYFMEDSGYHISADCLRSGQIDNLFFAGKNISATDKAIASARVIGTCLQTGYAAGKLASCNTDAGRGKIIALLQQELVLP